VLKGYFHFDFGKYFTDLYLLELPEYLQLTLLTFFVHTLVNNKFPGHVVSIGIWVLMFSLRQFGEYNYNLFFYSYTPGYTLSDMNGFGHFLRPLTLFNAYWLAFGAFCSRWPASYGPGAPKPASAPGSAWPASGLPAPP
jgi:hypothetical protein